MAAAEHHEKEEGSAAKAMAGHSYVSGTMLHDINDVSFFTEANKWGNMTQRVKWIIDTAIKGVFLTVVGVVEAVIWLLLKSYVIFIFFFYGILLLIARDLILWLCPPLAKYSKLLTDILDAIIWFLNLGFNALFDGVNIIMSFINRDIIGLINDVAKLLGLHKLSTVHFGGLRWKNIPKVDPDEVHAWLTGLPPTCQRFDGMGKIVLWLFQFVAAGNVCPVVRYMYPLEQTYKTHFFESLLGWSYPGSADPILFNNHTNCVPADHTSHTATALEISCVCLGLPYLFLEFFLPVVFLRAILPNIRPGFAKFWSLGVYFFEEIVEAAAELVAGFIKSVVLF